MILGQLAYGELSPPEVKMKPVKAPQGMKALAEDDRPREKLHALGASSLSNAELLAILLGTGTSELSVLDLCKRIMRSVKEEPAGLLNKSAKDFCKLPGIGPAKAATLIAAMELGRRMYPGAL